MTLTSPLGYYDYIVFHSDIGSKHHELLCGRNKFLSLVGGKHQSSKSGGKSNCADNL